MKPENHPFSYQELVLKRTEVISVFQDNIIAVTAIKFDSKFNFGKYIGIGISTTIEKDAQYIEWLIDSTDNKCFEFNEHYLFAFKFLHAQHVQLNAIKYEIAEAQQNDIWDVNYLEKEIPLYYKYIA